MYNSRVFLLITIQYGIIIIIMFGHYHQVWPGMLYSLVSLSWPSYARLCGYLEMDEENQAALQMMVRIKEEGVNVWQCTVSQRQHQDKTRIRKHIKPSLLSVWLLRAVGDSAFLMVTSFLLVFSLLLVFLVSWLSDSFFLFVIFFGILKKNRSQSVLRKDCCNFAGEISQLKCQ